MKTTRILSGVVAMSLAVGSGCVGVIGNRVSIPDKVMCRKPVVIEGRIYVVDVSTGQVMAMDPNAAATAVPFQPLPVSDDDR